MILEPDEKVDVLKRPVLVAAVAAAAMVAAYAAGAWSASPPTPTEKKLLRDVKAS